MSYDKEQQSRDWRFIFDTPEGHRALGMMLLECGLFADPFNPDPYIHAHSSGRKSVALDIVQMLGVSPAEFREISEAMREVDTDD